jgi:hypothetical protein
MPILTDVPRLPTVRNKIADSVLALLLLCSQSALLIGAVVGVLLNEFTGAVVGLAMGAVVGFWIRRSLGFQHRDLTEAYHLRMHQRGLGKRPRLLESLVETLRGNKLSMTQCRGIASTFTEAARELQGCHTPEERVAVIAKRNRMAFEIAYGKEAVAIYDQTGVQQHVTCESQR